MHSVGPIVTSEEARTGELDVSLLERLFERPLYTAKKGNSLTLMPSLAPYTNLVKVRVILSIMHNHDAPCIAELPEPPCDFDAAISHILQRYITTIRQERDCGMVGPSEPKASAKGNRDRLLRGEQRRSASAESPECRRPRPDHSHHTEGDVVQPWRDREGCGGYQIFAEGCPSVPACAPP
jgi:hypothetical protein